MNSQLRDELLEGGAARSSAARRQDRPGRSAVNRVGVCRRVLCREGVDPNQLTSRAKQVVGRGLPGSGTTQYVSAAGATGEFAGEIVAAGSVVAKTRGRSRLYWRLNRDGTVTRIQ
ncbi:hypothetical protein EPO04_02140 [Patescibacteria group bacterium]|nr:MAG: hypothetical protein EPO04_02140 [Patescibacteria group bacterium]